MKRRSNKAATRLARTAEGPQAKPSTPPPVASPARRWLFRALALLLPLIALGLLEVGLRVARYGHSTGLFSEVTSGGKRLLINNDDFALRFFSPELARWPSSLSFEQEKPADTCRIFILGESAAMGDPQPAFAASRYMVVLLRERFPRKKFEVINLGITAINSHVILPMAQECARQRGDLWIIYIGNNEMVGPFGAATIFGARAPPLVAVRLNLALQQTRVGQLLLAAVRKLGGKSANASWGGMQMFLKNQVPPDDRRKETVYRNFKHNLEKIVQAGLDSGAKVILNTVAVNLRDCPPFASMSNSNLPAANRAQFDQLYAEGVSLARQNDFANAAKSFEQAAEIDPHFAELQFRWGECLLRLTNAPLTPALSPSARERGSGALERFQLACDTDALPFRADSRINAIIRQVAAVDAGSDLFFCDAERQLPAQSPEHIPGDELFFEHVHFNPEGNYRLGRLWAEQVEKLLQPLSPALSPFDGERGSNWLSQAAADRRLGLSIWNRDFLLEAVIGRMSQPPLSSQLNNAARVESLRHEVTKLRQQEAQPDVLARTRAEFEAAVARAPDDNFLHESYANFLEGVGDKKQAIAEYRQIQQQLPHDFYSALQLGRLLGEQGEAAAGEPLLRKAVELRPSFAQSWYELGNVTAAEEKFTEALKCYDRAMRLRPEDATYICYKGKVLAMLHRRDEAIQLYRRAIQVRPDYWQAHFELAFELGSQDSVIEAIDHYLQVTRLNPNHAPTRLNLGTLLVRLNRLDDAIGQFEAALQLDPTNKTARDYLDQVKARKGRNVPGGPGGPLPAR